MSFTEELPTVAPTPVAGLVTLPVKLTLVKVVKVEKVTTLT
tara:strand:- start:856 stop:978 length:123 start_codon:yes stop_codon:yes gene_type:complete